MTGKEKCKILKQIRRDIAEKNDISMRIEDCPYQGECRGTCPKCEEEVRQLERELEKRRKAGLQTAVAGVSAGLLCAQMASCAPLGDRQDPGGIMPIKAETDYAGGMTTDDIGTDETNIPSDTAEAVGVENAGDEKPAEIMGQYVVPEDPVAIELMGDVPAEKTGISAFFDRLRDIFTKK